MSEHNQRPLILPNNLFISSISFQPRKSQTKSSRTFEDVCACWVLESDSIAYKCESVSQDQPAKGPNCRSQHLRISGGLAEVFNSTEHLLGRFVILTSFDG